MEVFGEKPRDLLVGAPLAPQLPNDVVIGLERSAPEPSEAQATVASTPLLTRSPTAFIDDLPKAKSLAFLT